MNQTHPYCLALPLASCATLAVFSTCMPASADLSRAGTSISNANLSITQSSTWGGAVVSYKYKGSEFIDVHDAGRLLQCSSYANAGWSTFTSDGYIFKPSNRPTINPNQAGDALGNPSSVFYVTQVNSTTLTSKCKPREWFTHSWPGLDAQGGAYFDTGRFIHTVTIIPGYSGNVTRMDFQLNPPVGGAWRTEVPALYMLGTYNHFYGVDAQNNTITGLTTSGINATAYTPASKIGGILATTTSNGKTIGIYGAQESQGGDAGTRFVCYNFAASSSAKIGTETTIRTLTAGQVQLYSTYIVSGDNPTAVKNTMVSLYNAGLR